MKLKQFAAIVTIVTGFMACSSKGEYVDLNTNEKIVPVKNEENGWIVNEETKKPVYLYVNTSNGDTLYGRTGAVVNTKVVKASSGKFEYDGDGEYKYINGDYKKKVDDNGEVKIKDGDYKKKVDDDGSYKIKDGDYKKKVDEDGDIKIKSNGKKIKIKNN